MAGLIADAITSNAEAFLPCQSKHGPEHTFFHSQEGRTIDAVEWITGAPTRQLVDRQSPSRRFGRADRPVVTDPRTEDRIVEEVLAKVAPGSSSGSGFTIRVWTTSRSDDV
jgi:hypothetical protein